MKAIIVDDEPIMLKSFMRISAGIPGLNIIAQFSDPCEALSYAHKEKFNLAILDIDMPAMSGIELSLELRKIYPDLMIVFITAHDAFIHESNKVNADYYIVKPYKREIIEQMVTRMELIAARQKKTVYLQMFGVFNIYKDGIPIKLRGKAKEILALVASRCGKEISNEEIYSIIWENRTYSNTNMKVYYNALKRLKTTLENHGLSELLLSTARGQILNIEIVDCDYFSWKEKDSDKREEFEGEFLSEYSWANCILANLLREANYLDYIE